jgi:hypothetical protein
MYIYSVRVFDSEGDFHSPQLFVHEEDALEKAYFLMNNMGAFVYKGEESSRGKTWVMEDTISCTITQVEVHGDLSSL